MLQTLSLRDFLLFGRPFGQRSAPAIIATPRDARIDVVRGLALLIIFINHMPGNVVSGLMPHNFGFSDAADLFVLLAGLSATLAYGAVVDTKGWSAVARRVGARVLRLYLAHLALFVIVCGMVAVAVVQTQNALYIEMINIQPVFSNRLPAVLDALALVYQPSYLDILPLYIVLLASFPVIYRSARFSPLLTLCASAALWQGAVWFGLNFPNLGSSGWFFNPFAWQLLFTVGVVVARARQLGVAMPRSRLLDVAALAFVVFAVVVKTASGNPFGIAMMNDWLDTVQLGSDKTNLAWVRVAHLMAVGWLLMRLLPAGAALLAFAPGRRLASMGRHSLPVFCAATVLSIAGQIVLAETSFALGPQLLVCGIGATMLTGLGAFLSWYHSVARPGSITRSLPSSSKSAFSA